MSVVIFLRVRLTIFGVIYKPIPIVLKQRNSIKKNLKYSSFKEASGMIVSDPVRPDRTRSFGDRVEAELTKMLYKGKLPHNIYFSAVDLLRKVERPITDIYGVRRHGLRDAIGFILSKVRDRLT